MNLSAAMSMTTLPPPNTITLSGVQSEPGLNGDYALAGLFRNGKNQWMKPNSRCYIRWIRDRWELYVSHHPNGTTYFFNETKSEIPPAGGWQPSLCVGPDEVLELQSKPPFRGMEISSRAAIDGSLEEENRKYILYTNQTCPFAQQVHIVLKESNIENLVDQRFVDIFTKTDTAFVTANYAAYPSKSRRASIPLLVGPGNIALAESSVIIQYLMDEFKNVSSPGLEPASSLDRARLALFVHAAEQEVAPCISKILNASNFVQLSAAVEKTMQAASCMESMLQRSWSTHSGPFFLGDNFTLAEAKTVPHFQRLCITVPTLRPEIAMVEGIRSTLNMGGPHDEVSLLRQIISSRFPSLSKWLDAVLKRESSLKSFHMEDVTNIMKRGRATWVDAPANGEGSGKSTKEKMKEAGGNLLTMLASRSMTHP